MSKHIEVADEAAAEVKEVLSRHMTRLDDILEKAASREVDSIATLLMGIYTGANLAADLGLVTEDIERGERAYARTGGTGRDQRDPKELVILFGSYVIARQFREDREAREASDCSEGG